MSKPENKLESGRPVIVPEYFTGEGSFEDWIDQFESIAEINHWNDGQKLMWLKVRLTGRALMAYKKFSVTARGSFKNAIKALQERFEPESRKDLYRAEFQTRCKEKTEGWPEFGEDLRVLVDRAYLSLEDEARQQLALQRYLSQLDNEQVAFSVKQGKPRTIEAAVSATLECESYLVRPPQRSAVAAVQMEPKDSALMEMMTQLMARMDRLEENSKSVYSKKDTQTTSDTSGMSRFSDQEIKPRGTNQEVKPRRVVCHRCGQEGHFARGCVRNLGNPLTRETRVPWGNCPDPKGNLKGIRDIKFCCVHC